MVDALNEYLEKGKARTMANTVKDLVIRVESLEARHNALAAWFPALASRDSSISSVAVTGRLMQKRTQSILVPVGIPVLVALVGGRHGWAGGRQPLRVTKMQYCITALLHYCIEGLWPLSP